MNWLILIFILSVLWFSCDNIQDNSKQLSTTETVKVEVSAPRNFTYRQAFSDSIDEQAEIVLYANKTFRYYDMRDESCWVWYQVFGKWIYQNDTLILGPEKEARIQVA